jgi:predicted PurR-regulated permease PerM
MERNDRWLATTLRVALVLLFFWMVRSLLVPISLGALFALILQPLDRRLRRRLGRLGGQTPLILTVSVLFLVVIPFALIAAKVVTSVNAFLHRDLTDVLNRLDNFLNLDLSGLGRRVGLDASDFRGYVADAMQQVGARSRASPGGSRRRCRGRSSASSSSSSRSTTSSATAGGSSPS